MKTSTIALVALALLTPLAMAGGKKSVLFAPAPPPKAPLMCRIPIIKNTPLCPDYNQSQIQKFSPKVPTR